MARLIIFYLTALQWMVILVVFRVSTLEFPRAVFLGLLFLSFTQVTCGVESLPMWCLMRITLPYYYLVVLQWMVIIVVFRVSSLEFLRVVFLGLLFLSLTLVACASESPLWKSDADGTSLSRHVPDPRSRSTGMSQLDEGLVLVSSWCRRWGMKLNPGQTSSKVQSRTLSSPQSDVIITYQGVTSCKSLKTTYLG